MNELTLYGLKSCDSCRGARKWLEDNGHGFHYHDVRGDGLDRDLLERWSRRLDWQKLLNRKSLTWRKISEVDRAGIDAERAITLMLENPTLLKRPLLECQQFVAVGFSADDYQNLFANQGTSA